MVVPWSLWRDGLRLRVILVLVAGLACAGAGFEILTVTLTRGWLYQELEARSRSVASLLGERSLGPMLAGDEPALMRQVDGAVAETDMIGATVIRADGSLAISSPNSPDAGLPPPSAAGVQRRKLGNRNVVEAIVPIRQRPGAEASPRRVGWVRIIASPERVERSVAVAAQAGIAVLLIALLLGIGGAAWLAHAVMRPLEDASGMAREIAAGRLDGRMEVRGKDEIGALARSMNAMASSLQQNQQRIEAESSALHTASQAVVTISQGTRAPRDFGAMFKLVASELRRVAECDAVALAVPREADRPLVFRHFDPPPPWGGLQADSPLEMEVLLGLRVPDGSMARLTLDRDEDSLSRGLAEGGFKAAMLVPLILEGEPQAVLLLASKRAEAFPPASADVVVGIATHLSAALHVSMVNDQLRNAIEELQRTHECLIQSEMLRVTGEMATGVAHEFNNLLASILGRAQLLNLRLHGGRLDERELATSLQVIERAAKDGSEIGRRLRQFGRGGNSAEPQPVHLDSVLLDAIEYTRPRWENEAQVSGRRIEVMTESWSGAYVMGHGNELREVFTNLILNALDALPRGGAIRLATSLRGDSVVARVEDDGIGMDEATRKRLFEPFFTTKGEGGTGLGLSVAYGIIRRHDATIEVDSESGQGTRMEIAFPRAAVAPADDGLSPMPEPGSRSLSIMVVDDDQRVREVLRDMLVALGHQVTAFESGDLALEAYEPGRYDLVLTDLGMPGITGWKLTQLLREVDPDVTIAFVTGWGDEVRPETVERAGVNHVVAKPFTFEDVASVTRLAIERLDGRPRGEPPTVPKAA